MKRINTNIPNISLPMVMSAIASRASLMSQLGYTHDGERNLYEALGYKQTLAFDDYASRYGRQDIAGAVIDKPIETAFKDGFEVFEGLADDTPLEKAWRNLEETYNLTSVFERVAKLASIGEYGIIFLGFDDVGTRNDLQRPSTVKNKKLLYIKPLSQGSAQIHSWEKRSNNQRFGLPVLYNVTIGEPGSDATSDVLVHYSRVVHVVRNITESEVDGRPELKRVYNRLQDIEKLVGGSAEMFWKGARPGYQGKVDSDFMLTDPMKETLQSQVDEYEHNLRRIFMNEGISLEALTPQVESPKDHLTVQLTMISIETGIPKRILEGSERGELASTQDVNAWRDLITAIRGKWLEPSIIRPFITLCQKYNILPPSKPKGYKVKWPDLWAPSDKEKADIGRIRSQALSYYEKNPLAKDTIPVELFYRYFLGLRQEDIDYMLIMREKEVRNNLDDESDLENAITEGVE